jgi:hypothetical protein
MVKLTVPFFFTAMDQYSKKRPTTLSTFAGDGKISHRLQAADCA